MLGTPQNAGDSSVVRPPVSVAVTDINRVLGVTITPDEVTQIFGRFGYKMETNGIVYTVTPSHERDDLLIKQDLIEEVGRIYGLTHIESIAPLPAAVEELNPRLYYAEVIRCTLTALGFSEVYTSSFPGKTILPISKMR